MASDRPCRAQAYWVGYQWQVSCHSRGPVWSEPEAMGHLWATRWLIREQRVRVVGTALARASLARACPDPPQVGPLLYPTACSLLSSLALVPVPEASV